MGAGPQTTGFSESIRLGSLSRFPGKSLLLGGDSNYYHFLITEYPSASLWLAGQSGFKIDDLIALSTFSPIHDSQQVVCDLVGIRKEKIIPLEKVTSYGV